MVLATRRMEACATLAKTAFLSSLKNDAPSRAAPSKGDMRRKEGERRERKVREEGEWEERKKEK